jgi:predicted phosphodiesterase
VRASVGLAGGLALSQSSCALRSTSRRRRGAARFGIVSDCHYADAETVGSRYYRQSLDKLSECVEVMNGERVDFLIELGDFKDEDTPAVEEKTISYLRAAEQVFEKFKGPRHHVLGNHDADRCGRFCNHPAKSRRCSRAINIRGATAK